MYKKKLKICFATEDFYPEFIGGQGVYGYHLVSELIKLGIDVTVLAETRRKRKAFWQNKNSISLILTPFVFGNQIVLAVFEYVLFIWKLKDTQFDIVHANQLSALLFVLFKPKNVNKIIVSVHNTYYDLQHVTESKIKRFLYKPLIFLEKIVYQKADGLIFNSPDEEKALCSYHRIINKPKRSIYLGTHIPRLTEREKQKAQKKIRRELTIGKNDTIVLYIGRLVKRKKVDILLKALEILNTDKKNVYGVIIGKGVEKRILEHHAPPNTRFLGHVENTSGYLLAANVFVTLSVAEGGFSLSVLEAAAYGLPLIVSPSVAGFPIIVNEKNGYVVDSDDPKILANKIMLSLNNSQKMGILSQKFAKRFSWKECAMETVDFYNSLL